MADVKHEPVPSDVPLPQRTLTGAESDRLHLDCQVRYWGLRARFLAQKLLSLGRSYEVRYRVQQHTPLQLPDLGFDVLSVSDAHLLQVKAVSASRFAQQIVNETPLAGLSVARPDDVRAIQVEDYLVGVDERDLLVAPLGLPHLRKRLQHLQHSYSHPQSQQLHAQTLDRVLVMRFVRLDRLVQVNQRRTHGYVLETLEHIETEYAVMASAYAKLLECNRAIVTRELNREKKLLAYVRILARDIKAAVEADDKFMFAFSFQQWYEAIREVQNEPVDGVGDTRSSNDDDAAASGTGEREAENDDDGVHTKPSGEYDEIEISDDDDISNDISNDGNVQPRESADVVDLTMLDADAQSRQRRLLLSASPRRLSTQRPPAVAATATAAATTVVATARSQPLGGFKPPTPVAADTTPRQPTAPPVQRDVDMTWLELFAKADLKWLPNAHALLSSFISGLLDSFEQDSTARRAPMTGVATAIAEQLVRVYIRKRFTLTLSNAALHKEFARHVRMLRSNVKNPKNAKLREDLLRGAVSPARLCEMSVDELAPEALRLERERRYELHAQSSMIKEPTGPTLVKTKHGYKEVNFGGLSGSQELESAALSDTVAPVAAPASASSALDEEMPAAPFEFDAPSVVAPADARDLPVTEPRLSESDIPSSGADIAQRFEAAVGIKPRTKAPKKRVTFADDLTGSGTQSKAGAGAPAAASGVREAVDEMDVRKHKTRARPVDPKTGRDFLLTLFDSAQDLVESLRMYIETLQTAPLATMSREFVLAPDVKFFRDSRANTDLVFTARLQLAHLVTESVNRNERHANIDAAYKLIDAVKYFRLHVDDLLTQLWQHFGWSAENNSRQVRDRVFSYLVEKSMVKFSMTPVRRHPERSGAEVDEFEAHLLVFELPVAQSRSTSLPIARGEASQEMLTFLVDLLAQRARSCTAPQLQQPQPPPQTSQLPQQQQQPQPQPYQQRAPMVPCGGDSQPSPSGYRPSNRPPPLAYDDATPRSYPDEQNIGANRYAGHEFESRDAEDTHRNSYRKRRYEPSREAWSDESALSRRRIDDPGVSSAPSTYPPAAAAGGRSDKPSQSATATRTESEAPVFFVDSAGERKPHADRTQRALTESQRIQSEVDAYQGLVTQLFRNRDGLMAKLNAIDWDTQREVECIEFDDKFAIVRIAKWVAASQCFECEIQAFGKRLVSRGADKQLDVAGRHATSDFAHSVDTIFSKWKVLVRTYGNRKKQTPTTLMAANEARAKNQHYVDLIEKRAGHLYECCIFVNHQMAIRHACLNQKMAKRSASEDFRDVLDAFLRLEEKQQQTATAASKAASGSASSTAALASTAASGGAAPSQARTPAPPRRALNLVLCSEDEDDDNDDDDDYASDYSSGSDYGGGAPAAIKSDKPPVDAAASSLKALIEREKKAPYDKASESARADDARFRAMVRSLFTANDALCAGIDSLRGSLKFRGSAENVVVPNVTAAIDMERLREGVYEVHVTVNDVVQFTASKVTKADACNAAIDGAVRRLHDVRAVWVQLLNFFHTKELALSDIMTSFHALRLANITSITSSIEKPVLPHGYGHRAHAPPTAGVHCVLRVGSHVTYRVVGDTEDEALQLADCRTAKFIMDLIDDGLQPDENDADTNANDTKMQVDGDDLAVVGGAATPSWSCEVRISDFIEDTIFHTFRVDGTWRQERDLPSRDDFPPPNLVATQVEKVEIEKLEAAIRDWHGYVVKFFSIESAHEQWKLVRHVAAYGHKSKRRAFALRLKLSPAVPYDMYLIPPGASINSEENLYWPKNVLPRSLPDRKQIYGLLRVRQSADESR